VKRHRTIAASPARSAAQTWSTIASLVADSVDRSTHIERGAVEEALRHAGQAGVMLVAGGHLESTPLTLIAGELDVDIETVSGDAALTLEENVNPVPGAAQAKDWMLYVPPVAPLDRVVKRVCSEHPNLSADEPRREEISKESASSELIDDAALARWVSEGTR
jgi:hypothetical protein